MPHDTPLISTIVIGLSLAFLFGLVAQRLRLPLIAGYLMAGIVIGPFTPGYVADQALALLTEGWDANTVTHVLGVRAFGTQLLCEQVIGRALRRQSYELNEEGLFNVEYADVLGIPFDFTAKPVISPPAAPRETVRVHAVKPDRDALEFAATQFREALPNGHERSIAATPVAGLQRIDIQVLAPGEQRVVVATQVFRGAP